MPRYVTPSGNDLTALDVIGWNLAVPEPASLALAGVWVVGIGISRRRRLRRFS